MALEVTHPPDPILTAQGASEGDPIAFVRGEDGILHRCRIPRDRMRWIRLGAQTAEHVNEHEGVWVYQVRRT